MQTLLYLIGISLVLAGTVFFLQGVNILPGSFMTGDVQWAITGGIMIVAGLGITFWASRRT